MVEGGEWRSFSGGYVHEEADFMAQLFPNCSMTNEVEGVSSLALRPTCWTSHEANYNMAGTDSPSIYSSDTSNTNFGFSYSSSYSGGSGVVYTTGGHENCNLSDTHHFLAANNSLVSIDFLSDPKIPVPAHNFFDERVEGGDDCLNLEMSGGTLQESGPSLTESELPDKHLMLKSESQISGLDQETEEKNMNSSNNSRRRPRVSDVQKGKRSVKSKKNPKLFLDVNSEEDNNAGLNRQVSGTCSSEDESHALQDLNGGATSSFSSKGASAKTRASRGSATDPQSLYARKRRERINERLRILQGLVPNGTKVDISTMLEEAVQYVKFLQLQIKLLSSDDLWMFAPIAYNGMDLGLDLNIHAAR